MLRWDVDKEQTDGAGEVWNRVLSRDGWLVGWFVVQFQQRLRAVSGLSPLVLLLCVSWLFLLLLSCC